MPETSSFLESRPSHLLCVIVGSALVFLAVLQLPVTFFQQNTKAGGFIRGKEFTDAGLVVGELVKVQDPAYYQIKPGDVVVALNGVSMRRQEHDYLAMVDMQVGLNVGDTLHIDFLRDGVPHHLDLLLTQCRNVTIAKSVTLTTVLFSVVSPLFMLVIAMIVLIRRPRNKVSTLFFLLSTSIAFYLLTSSTVNISIPWWHHLWPGLFYVNTATFVMFFPILLHFFLVFPTERRLRGSRVLRDAVIYLPYIMYLVIALVLTDPTKVRDWTDWLSISEYVLFSLSPFVSIVVLIHSYRKAPSHSTRKAMKILLIGLIVFSLACIILLSMNYLMGTVSKSSDVWLIMRLTSLLALTFSLPISFGYAIFRYGFMDVHVIFKRTAVYTIIALLTAGLFALMYFPLAPYMRMFSNAELVFLIVIITGLLAIAISALRDRIQHAVERTLFRHEFQVAQNLRAFSRALLNYLDRTSLLQALVSELPSILKLGSAAVVQIDEDGELHTIAGQDGPGAHLADYMKSADFVNAIGNEEIVLVHNFREVRQHRDLAVVFTLSIGGGEYLLVALGEKVSGRIFTLDELMLLQAVADHAVVGWRNATLAEEMRENERIKKEVEIAHTIQSAMLPRSTPRVDGIDLHALSCPAREVGGDFYDFMMLSDRELALVAGDVSDKGVSAAMVMASAISTVRFAAEEYRTPREIVARANERLVNDTRRHMFVAVFFGILDTSSLTLTFTNAGLPKPLLHRAGECYLLDWSENGGHLALGMKSGVIFHEQSLELMPGDILVLQTDGVVESSNINDEEFGVKRLRDTISASAHLDAAGIARNVTQEIQTFRGRQDLFDDLTLVVMKIEEGGTVDS